MITQNHLNTLIPRGKRKEVAVRAGVSTPAVSKYLNGKTKESFKIHKAALEVAKECNNQITELESSITIK